MNFIEAIKLARQGKIMGYKTKGSSRKYIYKDKWILVERPDVDVEDDYITYLSTHYSSTNEHLVKVDTIKLEEVYIEDILRDDWVEVEPKIELHSFEEAFKAFNEGKTIHRKDDRNDRFSLRNEKKYFTCEDVMANDWIIKER